jgi:hypothetical protein
VVAGRLVVNRGLLTRILTRCVNGNLSLVFYTMISERDKLKLELYKIEGRECVCGGIYVKLSDTRSSTFVGGDRFDLHDLNRVRSRSVTRAHVTVALGDRTLRGQVTVLAVHVVRARTRVVAQPDGEVLHLQWFALVDLEQNFRSKGILK